MSSLNNVLLRQPEILMATYTNANYSEARQYWIFFVVGLNCLLLRGGIRKELVKPKLSISEGLSTIEDFQCTC